MRSKSRFTLVIVALVLTAAAFSQALPRGVRKVTSVEGITEYLLPDGLRVLLSPDLSIPKVAALASEQVSEAFRRHIEPSAFSYVRAGDFKKAGIFQE